MNSTPSPPALAIDSPNFMSDMSLVKASQVNSFPSPKPKLPKNLLSSPANIPNTPFLLSSLYFFIAAALSFLYCS